MSTQLKDHHTEALLGFMARVYEAVESAWKALGELTMAGIEADINAEVSDEQLAAVGYLATSIYHNLNVVYDTKNIIHRYIDDLTGEPNYVISAARGRYRGSLQIPTKMCSHILKTTEEQEDIIKAHIHMSRFSRED